ncbi:uncharacterized protein LOC129402272 isoform X4 [Sorex araneus]|uniref:uncharacterized protein LOC129402272 isoform X4 n=1 Tax=Sorex araneus TaxID=42254 RepID=UPI0024340565|nr:uncharacterized protein LOC129402272 isoform X4 [Sorex araneus]
MRPAPRGARQGPLAEPSGNCARAPAPGKWEGGGGEARAPGSPQVQRAPRLPGRPSDSLPRLPDAGPPGCTSRCSKRERPRDAGEVAAGAGKGIKNRGTMTQEDADFYPEKSAWICQFPKGRLLPFCLPHTQSPKPLDYLPMHPMSFEWPQQSINKYPL